MWERWSWKFEFSKKSSSVEFDFKHKYGYAFSFVLKLVFYYTEKPEKPQVAVNGIGNNYCLYL